MVDAYSPRQSQPLLKLLMWAMIRKVRAQANDMGRYLFFFMHADGQRLAQMAGLFDARLLRPVLDRTFAFKDTLEAVSYVEEGRAEGKIVVVRDGT